MDLYRDSFRLSGHTFWRYLIALGASALLLVALVRRTPASMLVWLFLSIPLVLVSLALLSGLMLMAVLLGVIAVGGAWSALSARGRRIRASAGHLVLVTLVVGACTAGAFLGAGFLIEVVLSGTGLAGELRSGSSLAYALVMAMVMLVALFLSALAVPLTAIVHADADSTSYQSLASGFGRGLNELLPLAMAVSGLGALLAAGGDYGPVLSVDLLLGAKILLMVLAASWFFSHAVLIWEQKSAELDRDLALAAEQRAATRISARELRLARERQNEER